MSKSVKILDMSWRFLTFFDVAPFRWPLFRSAEKPRKDGPSETIFRDPRKAVSEKLSWGKFLAFLRDVLRETAEGREQKTYRGEGGQKRFSVGGLLARFCPPPPLFAPPHLGVLWNGVITKGVFSLEESLESLKTLNSLETLDNGRSLLYFPLSGGSQESLESLNSLESLENGLFWKDPSSKRPPFLNPTIVPFLLWILGLPRKQKIGVKNCWVQKIEIGEECRWFWAWILGVSFLRGGEKRGNGSQHFSATKKSHILKTSENLWKSGVQNFLGRYPSVRYPHLSTCKARISGFPRKLIKEGASSLFGRGPERPQNVSCSRATQGCIGASLGCSRARDIFGSLRPSPEKTTCSFPYRLWGNPGIRALYVER